MKISIGSNLTSGPWGGGNQAMTALADYLRDKGFNVYFDLKEPDIDIILLTEPRSSLKISAFTDREIFKYLDKKNKKAIVIHRINECDERKGTNDGVNRRLIRANLCADHTVFVSKWLQNLYVRHGIRSKSMSVILNGSDQSIFKPRHSKIRLAGEPLKLITHHWGGHRMKGFDIYDRLDKLLAADSYRNRISFTYIGNLPQGFKFDNAVYLEPMHGKELADAIASHDIYLTASKNEPGPNHQNEGALCGLPILYRDSGGMPEYCNGFGIMFNENNFQEKLEEMLLTYDKWADRIKDYPHTSERMSQNYYNLFLDLLDRRDHILKRRKWFRKTTWRIKKYF